MSRVPSNPLRLRASVLVIAVFCACAAASALSAGQPRGPVSIAPESAPQLREWDQRIDAMLRAGDLRVRQTREDALVAGRTHERLDQYHRGVRVFGADVSRQLRDGQLVSVFGSIYEGIDVDTTPAIDEARARDIVQTRAGVELGPSRRSELVVLPLDGGGYALAWRVRAAARNDVRQYFVDARSGAVVLEYSDLHSQSIGRAQGVLGDSKKISVWPNSGRFLSRDEMRPPDLLTFDMKGDYIRVVNFLNGVTSLTINDLASDSDNVWTDGAVDDAHVYAGYTYDYYFKRYGRRGLDNAELAIVSLVHPVRRSDVFTLYDDYDLFFTNAAYFGEGVMVYGVGLPPGVTVGGQVWDFTSGALDIVGHELTHGVTDYSSSLIYRNESGALNEAFSDMMGTAIEFYFQQPGSGSMRADYLIGEDVIRPGGLRSMSNPSAYGDPDHYTLRFTGTQDNGGVHINSAIPNQAFYLAIEGGTNRTSGIAVQGVGAASREQIEKVFYRAFTQLMNSSANFATARAATIQAARDLYPGNNTVERAVTQAWAAVGVN